MNRVIKFRVWRFCHAIKAPKFYYLNFAKTVVNSGANLIFCVENDEWIDDSIMDLEAKTVQQFTGLLDKTGREIYEGDIIKASVDYTVMGDDSSSYFEYKDKVIYKGSGFVTDKECMPIDMFDEIEVVGNIFENPELLG